MIPGYGMNKVNAAFSFGGPSLAVHTVEQLTGIRIDHLAIVDGRGFEELTDFLGGVDVVVPETTTDTTHGVTWTAGSHHLDGAQALMYLRQRYGLPGGDLDRVRRQQALLRTLLEEGLHQEMRKDPRMLYDFLDVVARHVSVDSEWSAAELMRLAVSLRDMTTGRFTYLTAAVAGFGRRAGQSVVLLDRQANRALRCSVIEDDVGSWLTVHEGDRTPAVVR